MANPRTKTEPKGRSSLDFLVLEAQTLVTALAAAGCAQTIARIALHAHLHIEKAGLSLRESCHVAADLLPIFNAGEWPTL